MKLELCLSHDEKGNFSGFLEEIRRFWAAFCSLLQNLCVKT